MRHPLLVVPEPRRPLIAAVLASLTLALAAWLGAIDGELTGPGSEGGIVGLEFCGSTGACAAQLAAIDARGASLVLAFSLGLDYLFMPAYSTAIAAALVFLGARSTGLAARAISTLAWALWGAALLDALETFALWQMLQRGASDPWPAVAAACALPKFTIVALGLVTVIGLALAHVARRARRSAPADAR